MLMTHVWEDTKEFSVSFRGFLAIGIFWVAWGLIWNELLADETLWVRVLLIVLGVVVAVGFVALAKMIRPTPRWKAEVESLRDSLMFKLVSLRDQPASHVELILTRPNGQRLLKLDIGIQISKGAEFWHQYPHGFQEGAAQWLVPGRYLYEWSVRPTLESDRLLVVARDSYVVADTVESDDE